MKPSKTIQYFIVLTRLTWAEKEIPGEIKLWVLFPPIFQNIGGPGLTLQQCSKIWIRWLMKQRGIRSKEEAESQVQDHSLLQNELSSLLHEILSQKPTEHGRGGRKNVAIKARSGKKCYLLGMLVTHTRAVTTVRGSTIRTQVLTKDWKVTDMLGAMQE